MAGTLQLAGLISLLLIGIINEHVHGNRSRNRRRCQRRRPGRSSPSTSRPWLPRSAQAALAWWNANVTGRDQDFQAKELAQNQLDAELSDPRKFARLKELKASSIRDPLLARQIAVLYLLYLEKQVDPKLLTADHGQGQCHREDVQCLSRQRERAIDHRQ